MHIKVTYWKSAVLHCTMWLALQQIRICVKIYLFSKKLSSVFLFQFVFLHWNMIPVIWLVIIIALKIYVACLFGSAYGGTGNW